MVDSHIAKVNYILHRQMPVLEKYAWQTPLTVKNRRISVYLEESRGRNCEVEERVKTGKGAGCEEMVNGGMMNGRKAGDVMGRLIDVEVGMDDR